MCIENKKKEKMNTLFKKSAAEFIEPEPNDYTFIKPDYRFDYDTFGCFLAILSTLIFIVFYYIFIKKQFKKIIPIIILFVLVSLITHLSLTNVPLVQV